MNAGVFAGIVALMFLLELPDKTMIATIVMSTRALLIVCGGIEKISFESTIRSADPNTSGVCKAKRARSRSSFSDTSGETGLRSVARKRLFARLATAQRSLSPVW